MKIIDMHAHLWLNSSEINKLSILNAIEQYNLYKVFVSPLGKHIPTEEQVLKINDEIYKFKKEYPSKIEGYAYLSPEYDNSPEILKRGIEEHGMIGAKIWVSEYCDSPCVNKLAQMLIDYDLPLLIHASKSFDQESGKISTAMNIRNLALRYPELKIIMAHIGGNIYYSVPIIRDLKNVSVDISGGCFRGDDIPYSIEHLGADRILFGSDMFASPAPLIVTLGQVLEAVDNPLDQDKILYQNATKLFNLEK